MEVQLEILNKIKSAAVLIDDMTIKAKEQGSKNVDLLFFVKDGFNELYDSLIDMKGINDSLMQKWNSMMSWVPRYFEDHPLLQIIREIDNAVINNNIECEYGG